ncbi:thermonuclease family protein [Parasphingorhabdus halotolerans]|uniref:thermonuclease family protein n=1 Tax=Parasphingorhabdus halotolerans TaxID=2725558 RepID=UPI001FED1EF8|nr:thermonuclease family protein [Parasphingorhabdus halotolerans]
MQFQLCSSAPRINCVVDGDTFWLNGEKIRLADIDTPETFQPRCEREHILGKRATSAFITLLNLGPVQLQQKGRNQDRYGRSLRIVERNGQSLGRQLIDKKLAMAWTGRRGNWCD